MAFQWTSSSTGANAPIDALTFTRLALDPQLHPSDWWSVMVELDGISIDTFEERVAEVFPGGVLVPSAYDADDRAISPERHFISLFARQSVINALNSTGNAYGVANVHLGLATPTRWLDFEAASPDVSPIEVGEGSVVMGVIDDGIGIAHELFRSGAQTTRVAFCAVLPSEPDGQDRRASQGRLLDTQEIDTFLADFTYSGLLDEDQFYQATGQTNLGAGEFSPVSLRRSHGTHVMGLTAGYLPDANEDQRPIICSVLPPIVVEDTSGASLLPALCLSLHLLSKQASRFQCQGQPVPTVLNFSYGNFSGPHDGTSDVSRLLEQFLQADPDQTRWMTLPAGNGNLARSHAELQFDNNTSDSITLDLRVLPDDRTASHVELWMPYTDCDPPQDFVSVTVTPPFGDQSMTVEAKEGLKQTLHDHEGRVVATLLYTFEPAPTSRGLITLSIEPTASHNPDRPLAPSGRWKIVTEPRDMTAEQTIQVWIRRDETLPGYRPGGRQSFFDNGDYVRFGPFGEPLAVDPPDTTSPVRRAGTLSGFACGPEPIVVAAYVQQERQLSYYSAAGPTTITPMTPPPGRVGPDVAAEGDQSLVTWGVLSAGSRSGSYVRLNGTSVSAPRVARLASDAINHWQGTARDWSAFAATQHPYELKDNADPTRMGNGGIAIGIDWQR